MCRKLLSWAWVTCLLWVPELVVKSIVKSHWVHIYDIPFFILLRFLWSGQFVDISSKVLYLGRKLLKRKLLGRKLLKRLLPGGELLKLILGLFGVFRWRASEIHHCSGNVVHWQGLSTQLA
jgi:hypothetical protein